MTRYEPFKVDSLPELTEPPSYFRREVRQSYQMNWRQLGEYILSLRQAGFDTSRLSVQWQKKFAFPLIAAIIVFLGAPFAFLVGTRGAVGGLALAVGIGLFIGRRRRYLKPWVRSGSCHRFLADGRRTPSLAFWRLFFPEDAHVKAGARLAIPSGHPRRVITNPSQVLLAKI